MNIRCISALILIWVTFILFSSALLAEPSALTLEIPESAVVPGPRISLGELGNIQGGTQSEREYINKIDCGAAPYPGMVRSISKDSILYLIKQYPLLSKLNLIMGPEVKVTIEAVCIKDTDIQKAINELLPKPKPVIIKKWIELNNPPEETWLRKDNWQIKAIPVGDLPELGPVLFKVILSSEKGKQQEKNISGKIRETAIVYRATRDLPRLSEIKPDDFEPVEMELVSGKELLGKIPDKIRAMRLIRQGEVLRTDQVQPVPLVHKDQEVTVVVRGPKVEVTLVGIAKADGWLGDEIQIMNPTSKKSFRGRVLKENMVEVILK